MHIEVAKAVAKKIWQEYRGAYGQNGLKAQTAKTLPKKGGKAVPNAGLVHARRVRDVVQVYRVPARDAVEFLDRIRGIVSEAIAQTGSQKSVAFKAEASTAYDHELPAPVPYTRNKRLRVLNFKLRFSKANGNTEELPNLPDF